MRYTTDNKQRFEIIVVPKHYTLALLRLTHDELGHNGSSRTYMMLRRLYFLERNETTSIQICQTM